MRNQLDIFFPDGMIFEDFAPAIFRVYRNPFFGVGGSTVTGKGRLF